MNYLSHLLLAGDDEGLMLGAMLGDFVRGRSILQTYRPDVRLGIRLHRHIDQFVDALPAVSRLRERFEPPFRRYAGIIIDMGYDHELALHWNEYCDESLPQFDRRIRRLLAENEELMLPGLRRFMNYANRRGLFEAYREESEILLSLKGIGTRLSRKNPLHRVDEIWPGIKPELAAGFPAVFRRVQTGVERWLEAHPS